MMQFVQIPNLQLPGAAERRTALQKYAFEEKEKASQEDEGKGTSASH